MPGGAPSDRSRGHANGVSGVAAARLAEGRRQPCHLVVAGEERLQVLPQVGVRRQELVAVGFPARLERLDVGQEDFVPPLFAVGVAGEFTVHGRPPLDPGAAREAASARGREARLPPARVRPICSRHLRHRKPFR